MAKHRAITIGAGRIGAGFNWEDSAYTHAGAYAALSDRVDCWGFVDPDAGRRLAAEVKWKRRVYWDLYSAMASERPDIVSLCVQPEQQADILAQLAEYKHTLKAIWCEKPYVGPKDFPIPIQVNYMRRGDFRHQSMVDCEGTLIVYAKDDIHTRCHFEDLAKWWNVPLEYRPFSGPCAYLLKRTEYGECDFFDNGGVDGGTCFKAMLGNLLDHIDKGAELWSPPR